MPAHSSGATAARLSLSETRRTNFSLTTMRSEYPPYVTGAVLCGSGELYVKTGAPLSQYCSSPSRQLAHVPHESTRPPTAARSPGLNFVTLGPTLVTRPTISWPGTQG